MTPCEELGYKVSDLFVYNSPDNDGTFLSGSIIKLIKDDGSDCPRFTLVRGSYIRLVEEGFVEEELDYAYADLDNVKLYNPYPTSDFKIDLSKLSEAEKKVAKEWLKEVAESRGKLMDLHNGYYSKELHLAILEDALAVQCVSNPKITGFHECVEDLPELTLTFTKPTVESWNIEQIKSEKELKLEALVNKLSKRLEEAKSQLAKFK